MNFQTAFLTVTKWVNSCETKAQLDTCKDCINNFFNSNIYPELNEYDNQVLMTDLMEHMVDRSLLIASKKINNERFPVSDEQPVEIIK